MFGEGVSKEGCILDMATDAGIIVKSGAWYTYMEEKLGQGREAAKDTLKANHKLRAEIEKKVRKTFGFPDDSKPVAKKPEPKQEAKSETKKDEGKKRSK